MKTNSTLKLFFAGFITVVLAFSATETNAKYASLVIDAKTGQVFHSVNEDTRNYPASLTKLMTLYLLFEAVEKKQLSFSTRLMVSRKAANRPASRLGLKAGQSILVKDAVMAIIIRSANDVASVIAESISGTERKFALKMTHKARKIGMSRTTFRNASGLPHRGQMSTARDMATLTRAIINRFPQYYHLFSRQAFNFEGQTYKTRNKVLKSFPGAEGMKTGYIRASGFNLITTAKQDGKRIIGVVFGGNTSRSRNHHMKKLLTNAFKEAKPTEILTPAKTSTAQRRSKSKIGSSTNSKNRIWGVQVGAFYNSKRAMNVARNIAVKYARVLKGGKTTVLPLRKSHKRILYRARIIGLNKYDAYRTCKLLKKRRKHCLELDLTADVEVASR
jgi:D-alanyl-D-alanine carboxypeptidase